jgi:hypothetical protein
LYGYAKLVNLQAQPVLPGCPFPASPHNDDQSLLLHSDINSLLRSQTLAAPNHVYTTDPLEGLQMNNCETELPGTKLSLFAINLPQCLLSTGVVCTAVTQQTSAITRKHCVAPPRYPTVISASSI